MYRSRPDTCPLWAIALLVVGLGLGGCGDDETGPQSPDSGDSGAWSDPAGPGDPGSPDGGGTKPAGEVLARLRSRMDTGEGNSGPSFQQDVEAVAAVLWGEPSTGEDAAAARVHTEVCNISGEVCRWLAESKEARVERTKSHPHDVGLHDAHVRAMAEGPDAYKAWCADAGAKQLTALKEARYKQLFPGR